MLTVRIRLKTSWFLVLMVLWVGWVTAIFINIHNEVKCENQGGTYAHLHNAPDKCLKGQR